jgi:hypothetical protein
MEAPVINIALYGLPKRNFFLESHFLFQALARCPRNVTDFGPRLGA